MRSSGPESGPWKAIVNAFSTARAGAVGIRLIIKRKASHEKPVRGRKRALGIFKLYRRAYFGPKTISLHTPLGMFFQQIL